MKAVLFPMALLATAVAAQTSSACAAEYQVQACLGTEQALFASCGDNDWNCKCNAYGDIVTCYNNCPNDPARDQAVGQSSIFCGYASQFPSSTTKAVSKTPAATNTDATPTPASTTGTSTGTSTSTASASAKTNSAAELVLNAGGVLAAVAGVVVAVL